MKTINLISIILFGASYSFCQTIDSTRLEFFPLHKGDIWQYGFSKNGSPQPQSTPFFVSVVDTLLPNGHRYAGLANVKTPNTVFKYLRVDSLLRVQQYIPTLGDSCGGFNELNTYRLGEKDSSIWTVCSNMGVSLFPPKCLIRFDGISLDNKILSFKIGIPNAPIGSPQWTIQSFQLTKGVGITATNDGDGGETYLTGAIINGKQIGNPILNVNEDVQYPLNYSLSHNYPNPFNPNTTISFSIPFSSHVVIKVFNSIGQQIKTLVDEQRSAGTHTVLWNGVNNASGIYFYQMISNGFNQTNKMILSK